MDVSEYIEAVTGQMRCKRARAMVAKELSAHIEDQTEDYLSQGMSAEEAAGEAVRQMGDAVEVGTEMDRIHRPGVDRHTLIMIAVLSLAAFFLQTVVIFAIRGAGMATGLRAKEIPLQLLVGVLLMVAILFVDYTILAKCPMVLWIALLILPILCAWSNFSLFPVIHFSGEKRMVMYLLIGLLLPAYAGLICHYRTKGWKGLAACALWLFATVFIYREAIEQTSLPFFIGFAGLLMLSYALGKGWFGISKVWSVASLWIGSLVPAVFWVFCISNPEYVLARLKALIFAALNAKGNGYITYNMREGLENLSLWGPGASWVDKPTESAMSFFIVMNKMGIIPGILILAAILLLFLYMVKGISKQKNVLGSLLGMACVLGLALPALGHILSCLTLMPYTDLFIPFLYPGWVANLASYTLLGLYLSVYRYKDVVA